LSLIAELKRRNVFRVGIAYAITTWVLLQVIDVITPILELPEWAPKLVLVILAVGFFPAMIFAWAFELTAEGLKRENEVDRTDSITNVTGGKLDRMIIGVLAVAVILLLLDRFTGPEQTSREAGLAAGKSIAVLPFINMSSDSEQEYFSDGITEEILNSLAAVKELKVAGRTSSFAFKGQNDDLRKIGDTLGVEHILEGSVRKAGTQVRITAQLIKVDDGFHLWSETYDRELTDIFAIQEEIASEILTQLRAALLDEEIEAFEAQRTDPKVYDLYLLARQRLYSRTRQTIESAVDLLDEAIAMDPHYAPAQAQRGIAAMFLSDISYGKMPKDEAYRQAKPFIDRALEIDPQLAEAWAGLGLYYNGLPSRHEEAIDALTKALGLNPNLIDASNWLYIAFGNIGEEASSLALIEDMTERDPLYRPAFGNGVQKFNDFGQPEKAQALIDRFRTFDPNDAQLLQADAIHRFYRGDVASGYPLAEKAVQLAPTDNVTRFVWSVALLQSWQIEELAETGLDGFRVDALDALGNRDKAFQLAFEQADEGDLENLLILMNRAGRSKDVTDYVEERWPTLNAFAADYPKGGTGHAVMAELAYAYARAGNTEKSDKAIAFVEKAMTDLSEQGVDQFVYMMEYAKYYALISDHDMALSWLEKSVERGLQTYAPLATLIPVLESLREDPRFIKIEAMMIDNINEDRLAIGLEPIDPYLAFWQ
jgi:TolB-like protein/Tfp pilus assembly protein PilF